MKIINYLFLISLLFLVGCNTEENSKQEQVQSKPTETEQIKSTKQYSLINLNVTQRDDLIERDDITNYSKFDSLSANWSGDTLYLSHVFMKSGTCGDFELKDYSSENVVQFIFKGIGDCSLATFFQIDAKLHIPVNQKTTIYYNGCLIKQNTSAIIKYM